MEIQRNVFSAKKGKVIQNDLLSQECISHSGKRGGKLQGNQCRKFLRRLDKLDLSLQKLGPEVTLKGLPYLQCLRNFDQVVHLCFGQKLLPGYELAISNFSDTYRDLGISVTPKVGYLRLRGFFHYFYLRSILLRGT